jgi:hypothetical protein
MEAMQADGLLDDTLFQKSTGMRNPDGKTGGRLDRLKKQREEKLMDGKVCQEFKLQVRLTNSRTN